MVLLRVNMEEKVLSNPEYIGPGVWLAIHRTAFEARTPEKQDLFLWFIEEVLENFPCPTCRVHSLTYMKERPPAAYRTVQVFLNGQEQNLGLFLWSWLFHNAVNSRLGKPALDWETAYNLYQEEELICSKICLAQADAEETVTIPSLELPKREKGRKRGVREK